MSSFLAQRAAWSAASAAAIGLALIGAAASGVFGAAWAQDQAREQQSLDQGDALIELFDRERTGQGDPHLPFVLNDLKRAVASHDMVAFLRLVDPEYFQGQFELIGGGATRSPGDALNQFSCEFFSVCDISKSYAFTDIVSAHVLAVAPDGGLTGGEVEVRLELRMWDGLLLESTIFYRTDTARLLAAVG